ncbi:hypothetical protein J3P77_22355 (plasmid) [Pseudomonas sp. R1-18]|uniref:hypothetical protein n=1 Tax=Pseudomonas sp. R1-18 TaxID=1632772 RepID=UPI003DA7B07E
MKQSSVSSPGDKNWNDWFDGEDASADFLTDREQPLEQQPESINCSSDRSRQDD